MKLEELTELVSQLFARIDALEAELAKKDARIAELEARLNQNSQNSSKPPSSDKPWLNRVSKQPTGKRRGAQPGHKAAFRTLLKTEETNAQVFVPVSEGCLHCLKGKIVKRKVSRRHQVWELPESKPLVTEFQIESGRCNACGRRASAGLPSHVSSSMLGPRVQALASHLTGPCRLSRRQTEQLFLDAFGLDISLGTVSNTEERVTACLEKPCQQVERAVQGSFCAHIDETSHRQGKQKSWVWVASTPKLSHFRVGLKRSREAFKKVIGQDFSGVAITDRYNVYADIPQEKHQLCWAHILREFKALSQQDGSIGDTGKRLVELCHQMFSAWHDVKAGQKSLDAMQSYASMVHNQILSELSQHFPSENQKLRSLTYLFFLQGTSLWRFVHCIGVEPTNNQAERDLRPAVIWRKTSLFTQSERGDRYTERILTFTSTCRKQCLNVLDKLHQAIRDHLNQTEFVGFSTA